MSKSGEGTAADTQSFPARAQALMATLQGSPRPRSVVADAKLSREEKAANLKQRGVLPRLPGPRKRVTHLIAPARRWDTWHRRDETTHYQAIAFCPYGLAQRWLVGWSPASDERAGARVDHAGQREAAALATQLFHVPAQRFETPPQAQETWSVLAKQWRSHPGESEALLEHTRAGKQGRPTAGTPLTALEWPRPARVKPAAERLEGLTQHTACFVLGPNIQAEQRREAEGSAGDKGHAQAEGGCRCLTDPLLFVSALLVKQPGRSQGRLMVMTWALLVYAVAQRRLRRALARQNEPMPHHINQPTSRPTLRGVLQVVEGIERVRVTVAGEGHDLLTGVKAVKIKILRLFGEQVCHVYQLPLG